MNFSGYFILVGVAVLVLFAQQSDADLVDFIESGIDALKDKLDIGNKEERDAIRTIKESAKKNEKDNSFDEIINYSSDKFIKGIKKLSASKEIIDNGLEKVKNSFSKNDTYDAQSLKIAFRDAEVDLFESGLPVLRAVGLAYASANDETRQGLIIASILVQKAGFSTLNSLTVAEDFLNRGITAEPNAIEELLDSIDSIIQSGYTGSYGNVQKSFLELVQTLRNAQNTTMQGQVTNRNCEAVTNDIQASDALNNIYEIANNTLKRGAKPELVEDFTRSVICSIGNIAKITAEGQGVVKDINKIVEAEPSAALIYLKKKTDNMKEQIHNQAANMYLDLGVLNSLSGRQCEDAIDSAILTLEEGKVQYMLGIDKIEAPIFNGLKYSDDALSIGIQAANKALSFGKIALLEKIVKYAQIALSIP